MAMSEEKKDDDDNHALFLEMQKEGGPAGALGEEGLEAVWEEPTTSTTPVAPSALPKNRTSFGLLSQRKVHHNNRASVRLLEADNRSTTVEKEPSPTNNKNAARLSVDTTLSDTTASQTTNTTPATGDHDLSTLGFDNTLEGHETTSPMSMSSLNEILDGSSPNSKAEELPKPAKEEEQEEEKEEAKNDKKKKGNRLARALSPRKERAPSPRKGRASSPRKGLAMSPKKKTAEKTTAPSSPSGRNRKSLLGRLALERTSRSVPVQSSKEIKDEKETASTLPQNKSFDEGVMGGSPFRRKKKVERFVATVVEKGDEEKTQTQKPEDSKASEVENQLMKQLEAAMMEEEDCESVTSSDGVKKFATMNPPAKRKGESSPSRRSMRQKEPSSSGMSSPSTSFIAAPKNVPPALLMQKSWDSLIRNEDVLEQDAPHTITTVPSRESDGEDDKYSIRQGMSQDKYSVSKEEEEEEQHTEEADKYNPAKTSGDDSIGEENVEVPEEVVASVKPKKVMTENKETKDTTKDAPSPSDGSNVEPADPKKATGGLFASFGRNSKKPEKTQQSKPARPFSESLNKTTKTKEAAKKNEETAKKREEAAKKREEARMKKEEAAKKKEEEAKKKKEEAAKKRSAAEEKKRADLEAKQQKKKEIEAKKLAAQKAREDAAEQKKAENESKRLAAQKAKQEANQKTQTEAAAKKEKALAYRKAQEKQPSSRRLSGLFGGSKRQVKKGSCQTEPTESEDLDEPIQVKLFMGPDLKRVDPSNQRNELAGPKSDLPVEDDDAEPLQVQLYYGPDLKRVDDSKSKGEVKTQHGVQPTTSSTSVNNEGDLIQHIRTQSQKHKRNGEDPPIPSGESAGTRVALDP